MAAHRYWRVYYTATSDGWAAIAEIAMHTTVGGGNVISGGTASASSSFSGFPASSAIDSNASTAWASNGAVLPSWWEYDFGAGVTKDIVEFVVTARTGTAAGESGSAFQLQFSDDNSTWTTAWSWTGVSWTSGQTQTFAVPTQANVSKLVAYAVLDTPPPSVPGYSFCFIA